MRSLAILLWWIFVVFTILSILACIESWIHYHRKPGIDTGDDQNGRYRYFVQSIRDRQSHVVGYALLLREYDEQSKQWHLPERVADFPLSRVISVIQDLKPYLKSADTFITLNVTATQVLDFRISRFIGWAQDVLPDQRLVFEISVSEFLQSGYTKRRRLNQQLKEITSQGVSIIIEDVDSSMRTYLLLRDFLPNIQYLKFKAQAFNKSQDHWIDVTLGMWQKQLQNYHIQMILEQVENPEQSRLADQLGIPYRQGYLYDRPRDISSHADRSKADELN